MLKAILYWGGIVAIACSSFFVVSMGLLPIQSSTAFCLGLAWVWIGLASLLGLNPTYAKTYTPKGKGILCLNMMGMGIVWAVFSLFPGANSALWMIGMSLPFVFVGFWAWCTQKAHE